MAGKADAGVNRRSGTDLIFMLGHLSDGLLCIEGLGFFTGTVVRIRSHQTLFSIQIYFRGYFSLATNK